MVISFKITNTTQIPHDGAEYILVPFCVEGDEHMQRKYCAVDGCSNLVDQGIYCTEHAVSKHYKRAKRQRKSIYHHTNKPFYHSEAWHNLCMQVDLREHNRCQHCGKYVWGRRKHHHHVVPIVDDPSLALDPNNIRLLCDECHPIEEHATDQPKVYASYFGR